MAYGKVILSFWLLLALFSAVFAAAVTVDGERAPAVRRRVLLGMLALVGVFVLLLFTLDGL